MPTILLLNISLGKYLAAFQIALDNTSQRLPYATIASAIAKAEVKHNGNAGIGAAIANCYDQNKENGNQSEQAKAKLRRLLACHSVQEVCRILRPLFSLIGSRSQVTLDYVQLLKDLLYFNDNNRQRIKARWAQDFYGRKMIAETKEAA